jgi:hypothetical protein
MVKAFGRTHSSLSHLRRAVLSINSVFSAFAAIRDEIRRKCGLKATFEELNCSAARALADAAATPRQPLTIS